MGLFVKLDCSWWAHPFASNRFKISSTQDIATIRGINRLKLYYDPVLSDPLPSESVDELDELKVQEEERATELEWASVQDPAVLEAESVLGPATDFSYEDAVDSEEKKLERKRLYHGQREHFKKVEDAYWRTLGSSKDIFKKITAGRKKGVQQAEQVITQVNRLLDNNTASMTLMDVVTSTGMAEGLSSHALNVCILSTVIGRELGLAPSELQALGLGALFHDIGKRLLPMKVNFQATGITMATDSVSLILHPAKGMELLEGFPDFPEAGRKIIFQHHERLDGSGYPSGLKEDAISQLAQIVMVADEYDELCNAVDPDKCLTPHEALSHLYRISQHPSRRRFSESVILALIKTLTVFPPGTLVELSDGTVGIVTSIRLHMPTQPLIMASVAEGGKRSAVMIDLSHETDVTIVKGLRPQEVPPKILEFLSPRRTAVFLHPGKEAPRSNPGGTVRSEAGQTAGAVPSSD